LAKPFPYSPDIFFLTLCSIFVLPSE
jgi:hypothetical protein